MSSISYEDLKSAQLKSVKYSGVSGKPARGSGICHHLEVVYSAETKDGRECELIIPSLTVPLTNFGLPNVRHINGETYFDIGYGYSKAFSGDLPNYYIQEVNKGAGK